MVVGVLLSAVVRFVLALLCGLLINALWPLVVIGALAIFWVFNRALRQVFARSRVCKRRLLPSVGHAVVYTSLYTGWLFGQVWMVHRLTKS